jgi:hypothetical protein
MLPFLTPRSPNSMSSFCHGILPKVVSALLTTLNCGEGKGETKFVLLMFINFVILAGMVSMVFSKIVVASELNCSSRRRWFSVPTVEKLN